MPTLRCPVLLWRDPAGACAGALVGDLEPAAASAPTEAEVLGQLQDLLEWRLIHESWNAEADFDDVVLTEVKVEVRPQYAVGQRLIPCPDALWLKVPCLTGRQASGLRLCVIPHLELRFNFHGLEEVPSLVAHYVKDKLQRLAPSELASCLPPAGSWLAAITLRQAGEAARAIPIADRPGFRILFRVADPLLQESRRSRSSSAAYGREGQSEWLARKLGQERVNLLLVGASGVGKTTLLLDAARRLARSAAPSSADEESASELRNFRFWRCSGGRLVAGMCYLGEWEERCEKFLSQLTEIEGVFCAENLLELVQVGGQGPGDGVAAFLMPYLQRGDLRMVAEATPEEVEACRRLLPGLLDLFQVVVVPEFDEPAAMDALGRLASAHAKASRLEVEAGLVATVHRLFRRFQPYAAFPGPAAGFVRSLCDARSPGLKAAQRAITSDDAIRLFAKQTGLPELFLRDECLMSLDEVRRRFAGQIVGQPEAVDAAANLVASIKTGLSDPARPLGVLLFCGPSGVGKTALARALVDYCFGAGGAKDRLVRLDMSEYSGWGAAQRFLQNSNGQPAAWIECVRRHPFCVVLFDEIEKAAPEVFDALLGVLDEGRLTDPWGRVTWFRSAVVIMTSNLGSQATSAAGFGPSTAPSYEAEVAKFFRPEFVNRLDAVMAFRSLGREEIEAITRKELGELGAREGLAGAGIELTYTDRLVAAVAREGYDDRLGARPLQRALEAMVAVPLARWRVSHPESKAKRIELDLGVGGEPIVKVFVGGS